MKDMEPLREIESRLEELERVGKSFDRLYSALREVVQVSERGDSDRAESGIDQGSIPDS
jgi:hypothetical protein